MTPPDPDVPKTRVIISIPCDLLSRVEDFRFEHRIASRAEAIRQLLETALAVQTKKKSR